MSADNLSRDERAVLAGEFALGLLEGKDLSRATALLASDPEFRAEVARWSSRFAGILEAIEPVAPDPALFSVVERRIAPDVANDNERDLQRSLARWRGASAGLGAVAAALALVLLTRPQTAPVPAPGPVIASTAMIATIAGDSGPTPVRVVANWDPARRQLIVTPAIAPDIGRDRSMELWVIPADGKPHSIGIMPDHGPMRGSLDASLGRLLASGATLAISIERKGGSTTGSPQGPVVGTGKLAIA